MLLLASKSPRRRELLGLLDIPFQIAPSIEVEEVYPPSLPHVEVPLYLSQLKAQAYLDAGIAQFGTPEAPPLLITADTVVLLDGMILGKPSSLDDARRMLRLLAGRSHQVVTGLTVTSSERQEMISVMSEVSFGPLSDQEIDYYVDNYRPLDKAGAYGIQEWIGAVAVTGIEGSYYNVMGLPVQRLYQMLKTFC
ncbi:MAG: Maf family nucleotide pyrophosphatase [Bacteroidales bacterium]|nr:Maf family nucleotide pyrophosphatase [Bacteroidales bacterium]